LSYRYWECPILAFFCGIRREMRGITLLRVTSLRKFRMLLVTGTARGFRRSNVAPNPFCRQFAVNHRSRLLEGIIRNATPALAIESPAQISTTTRNPKTNACTTATWIFAEVFGSTLDGAFKAPSLTTLD
jgi:hypothetical protein